MKISTRSHAYFCFKNHDVRVGLRDGKITSSRVKNVYRATVPYDSAAQCRMMDDILKGVFSLCLDTENVIRHFWEFIGYLMAPSMVLKYEWVMFGKSNSGKHELFRILDIAIPKAFSKDSRRHNIVTMDNQTSTKEWRDEQIRKIMVFPFYSDYGTEMESLPPLYWHDFVAEEETQGIYNKAIDGLSRLTARGCFDIPGDCIVAKEDYLQAVNHISKFVKSRCSLVDDDNVITPLGELWSAYLQWADDPRLRMTRKDFIEGLRAMGIEYARQHNFRIFRGIALLKNQS